MGLEQRGDLGGFNPFQLINSIEKNTQEGSLVDRNAADISILSGRLQKVHDTIQNDRTLGKTDMGFLLDEKKRLEEEIENLKKEAKEEINSPKSIEENPILEG